MRRIALAITFAWFAILHAAVAAERPPIEDYGKLPGLQLVKLSPSGERYAMVATIDGKRQLLVASAGNVPIYLQELGSTKVRNLEWAGDGYLMVLASQTVNLGVDFRGDKHELAGGFVINVQERKHVVVFGDPHQERVAHTVAGAYGAAQVDGRWYGYYGGYSYVVDKTGGRLKHSNSGFLYPDLYRVDLDTGAFQIAAEGQSSTKDWLVSPAGDVAARLIYNQANGDWRIMSSKWSGSVLGSGRAPIGDVGIRGFGRTPDTVLIRLDQEGRDIIREVSLINGDTVATYDTDVAGFPVADDATRLWIGSSLAEDAQIDTLFSPVHQARLTAALKAFPGYVARMTSHSADFNRLIVRTEGGDDSGTYWLVDIAKRSAEPIGAPYPSVRRTFVGPVRWLDYKAADGLAMRGILTLPPGSIGKNLPLVVMPHGGPEAHDGLRFDYWAQAFASRGYAVFQPNFRGSTGAGKAFHDAGFGQWGRKMQTDVSDGVAELARQGVINPQRVCIVGGSYGGYAALAGVTVQQGLYRCAVSYGGVSDPETMLTYVRDRVGAVSAAVRRWKHFMAADSGADVDDVSPARLAGRADAPVLLIHGKDDTVVPITQSTKMERALRAAGKPVELVTLPGADHWLLQEDSRIAMLKASVAFVLKHNPPDTAVAGR